MSPSKHSAICAEIQERSSKKETILRSRIADLEAANAELLDALSFYAEHARLCRLIHSEGDAGRNALAKDGGDKASAAIKKHGGSA